MRSKNATFDSLWRNVIAYGDRFHLAVQFVVIQVAGRVLDLDDVVAEHLGEPQLARITAETGPTPATTQAG